MEYFHDLMKKNDRRVQEIGPLLPHPASWDVLIGQVFSKLTVLGYTGLKTKYDQKLVTCRCVCGFYVGVPRSSLLSGNTRSCGCLFSQAIASRNEAGSTHGQSRGGKITDEYRAWQAMNNRCYNTRDKRYKDYGGRGIEVYQPWRDSFQAFFKDVGPRPSYLFSVDRIDNSKGYFPDNVRWATAKQQNRNRRVTKLYEYAGVEKTLAEWAELAGLPYERVKQRVLTYGWDLSHALGTPVGGCGRTPDHVKRDWIPPAELG